MAEYRLDVRPILDEIGGGVARLTTPSISTSSSSATSASSCVEPADLRRHRQQRG